MEITSDVKQYVLETCITTVRQALCDDQPSKIARAIKVLCLFVSQFEMGKV